MADQTPEIDSIFAAALALDVPEERAAYLEKTCGGQPQLRSEVERMLAAQATLGSFLEQSPLEDDVTLIGQAYNEVAASLDAGLAPTFGTDAAVVIGDAGHSVLKSLGQACDVPRVALRDPRAEGPDPITQPQSPEMPRQNSDSRYQLQGEIARGGMGAILKGRDTDLGRDLAIKVLLDTHKDKPDVIQRFVEEAQIGGQLQHPGIVPVYELGQFSDKRPFFSMKLVKGETLSNLLAERKTPAEDRGRFLGIFEQACQTMAYAHSRGVIHRDLKPANIMVGSFGEVQVMDWGLAKVLPLGGVADEKKSYQKQTGQSLIQTLRSKVGSDAPGVVGSVGSQTQFGSVMGTPAYMPPEQALGEIDNMDERADVFGLGAILCEILTGKPPYVAEDGTRVFRMASRGKLEDCLQRLDSCGADAELIALARHCLELEPVDRPRDAGAVAERVSSYLESVETKLRETEVKHAAEAARADAEAAQASAERNRRRTSLALAFSVLLLVSLGSGGWLYLLQQEADRQTAEAETQRKHAVLMQALAHERDEQRIAAEQAKTDAQQSEQDAIEQRNRADQGAEITQQNLYLAQMHLAQQAWREHRGLQHMHELLTNWGPDSDQEFRRKWEWFYINSLPYQNLKTFPKPGLPSRNRRVAWHIPSGRIAEAALDGVIRIWNVEREQIVLELQGPPQDDRFWGIDWFTWSPDGEQLAVGGRDGTVQVWDTASGAERLSAKVFDAVCLSLNFNAAGTEIAVCGHDGGIRLVNTQTGAISPGATHPGNPSSVAWSSDHQRVAMGYFDGTVTWSDILPDSTLSTLQAHPSVIYSLAWSPDGRQLATTDGNQFYALIWNLDTQQPATEPLRHSHAILSMAWSSDGSRLATASADQTAKIWKTADGREEVTLRGHTDAVYSLAWGPENRSLASGSSDGSLKLWTSTRDQESLVLPGTIRTTSVAWSPDGKRLAAGSDDGHVRVWDPVHSEAVAALPGHDSSQPFDQQFGLVHRLAWSPDGKFLASAGADGTIALWDVLTGESRTLPSTESGAAWSVAWSPDGSQLAAGFQDGKIHIFEGLRPNPVVRTINACATPVFALGWNPQGDRLASGTFGDNFLRVWDPVQGTEVLTLNPPGSVLRLAWSPDGKQLAASTSNFLVVTWNALTGERNAIMRGHNDFVNAVVWSPDGSRLASAGFDNSVRIWDPENGAEACVLRGRSGFFHDVSWNSDGARVAAACSDGSVWIWDATRGYERDTTPAALPYIDRAISAGTARGEDLLWYLESCLRQGKTAELNSAVYDHRTLSHLLRLIHNEGLNGLTDSTIDRAISGLEEQLTANPNQSELAASLADLLLYRHAEPWTVLKPAEMASANGAKLKLRNSGTIIVSGENVDGDIYTLAADCPLHQIAAVRLEVLTDISLPSRGPGRHPSGNFHLRALKVYPSSQADQPPASFAEAFASFNFQAPDADIAGLVDEQLNKVWHVWGRTGESHQALFRFAKPLVWKGGLLTHELVHHHPLGCFRLSVSADPAACDRERRRIFARNITDPWSRLAAVYDIVGNQAAVTRVLEHHPESAIGLADLLADEKRWPQAIACYTRVITPVTTDPAVYTKRAAAYLATEQWDLAKADWLRAVDLNPSLAETALDQFRFAERWSEALEFGQKLVDANSEDAMTWLKLGHIAARTSDETYREYCRRFALHFQGTMDPVTAERVVKPCLLRPGFIELKDLPVEVFTRGLDENTVRDGLDHWLWGSRALLAYRTGDAESAVKYAMQSEALGPFSDAHLLNLAILAMAEHELGHPEKSQLAFDELSQRITAGKAAGHYLTHDFQLAELLLAEATLKLSGPPAPAGPARGNESSPP